MSEGNGVWTEYAGGYSDMLALSKKTNADTAQKKPRSKQPSQAAKQKEEKPTNQEPQKKLSYKQQYALETLPDEIEKIEYEIGKLKQALSKPGLYEDNPEKFNAWAGELSKREKLLMAKEEEWFKLEALAEEISKQ